MKQGLLVTCTALLVSAPALAQVGNLTSTLANLKLDLSAPITSNNGSQLASALAGLAKLQGYTCGRAETYRLYAPPAAQSSLRRSAQQQKLTYQKLSETRSESGWTFTLFRVGGDGQNLIGSWAVSPDLQGGTLALCEATKK